MGSSVVIMLKMWVRNPRLVALCNCATRRLVHYDVLETNPSVREIRGKNKWTQPVGYPTRLNIFNSVVKQKVNLILRHENFLSWYCCGPTVYAPAHIGHACCYVKFDTIRRILEDFHGINTVMVMGITDIDDKIIAKSNELQEPIQNITRRYESEFFEDMCALNVKPPSIAPHVTSYVPEIIQFVQKILLNGHGYAVPEGSVYFSTASFSNYGKLSLPVEAMEDTEARIEKRSPQDFALWKAAKEGEPWWESPWGRGRPGWHIECSAIASTLLGPTIDLHTGGVDLLFPHHENEEAQSCAHHGVNQWVNYWLHTGHLYQKGDVKMSKSLDNTISIQDFLKLYSADQLRIFCLISSYRDDVEYSDEKMTNAVAINKKFNSFLADCRAYVEGHKNNGAIDDALLLKLLRETEISIDATLCNDFDTPRAMQILTHLISATYAMLHKEPEDCVLRRSPAVIAAVADFVHKFLNRLGLSFGKGLETDSSSRLQSVIDAAVTFRQNVRQSALSIKQDIQPQFAKQCKTDLLNACGNVRSELSAAGVELKDHGKTTSWSLINEPRTDKQ